MSDAVVIGAGPNGLAAAIRLAEAGVSVVVLEAQDTPGGAVRTQQLTLPGFHHDTFSSVHPAGIASPVFARMPLADHGLQWVQPQAPYAHPLPDGSAILLHRDLDRTADALNARHHGDGDRWRSFTAPLLDAYPQVRETMFSGFPPLRGPLGMLRHHGPRTLASFTRLLPDTAVRLGGRLFQNADARVWLYASALHSDQPPDRPGSAIAAFYLNLLGHAVGWPSPRGGAQRLTDALVSYLRALGGEVRTNSPVVGVLSRGGAVTGVRTAGGEVVPARIVVADVMPDALLRMTGDALSAWYRAALRAYAPGQATLKLDWALDGPIPWTDPAVATAGTVHVGGDEPDFLTSIRDASDGLPERPFMLLGQQTLADPSRAPEGKHTAWAYTHGPAEGIDWPRHQEAHAERMEAHIERYAPGFRDRILARHLLGPVELQERNANLVGGDVGGGSYRLRQLVFRPVPKLSPYTTPLTGLYLGSAATFPGGAVHGVCGDAAAQAALRARLLR